MFTAALTCASNCWMISKTGQLHSLLTLCTEWLLFHAQGYAPIRQDYEDFYTRRMYYRIHVITTSIHC